MPETWQSLSLRHSQNLSVWSERETGKDIMSLSYSLDFGFPLLSQIYSLALCETVKFKVVESSGATCYPQPRPDFKKIQALGAHLGM